MAVSSAPPVVSGVPAGAGQLVEGSPQQRAAEAALGEVAGPALGSALLSPGRAPGTVASAASPLPSLLWAGFLTARSEWGEESALAEFQPHNAKAFRESA